MHLKHFKALWLELDAQSAQERARYLESKGVFLSFANISGMSLLFKGKHSLGLLPRLFVLRKVLSRSSVATFNRDLQARIENFPGDGIPAPDALRRILDAGNNRKLPGRLDNPNVAVLFAKWLDDAHPLDACRSSRDLFDREFVGTNAFEEFEAWAKHGYPIRTQLDFLPENLEFILSDDRKLALARLQKILSDDDAEILVNGFQREMPNGLTAIASELVKMSGSSLKGYLNNRPVLYVSLRGRGGDSDASPSYAQLLGYLRAFFLGQSVALAPELKVEESPHDAVLFVRRQMSKTPAIIVLDGYVGSQNSAVPALDQMIQDDNVLSLIRQLAEPPLCLDPPIDLRRFRANRIVLLSHTRQSDDGIEIPLPEAKDMPAVLAKLGSKHEAILQRWLAALPELLHSRSESVLRLLDGLICVDMEAAARKNRVWNDRNAKKAVVERIAAASTGSLRNVLGAVADTLLTLIENEFPAWKSVIILAALVPDGLRLDTLFRLVVSAQATRGADLAPYFEQLQQPAQAYDELLFHCKSFLGASRNDRVSGLDDYNHPWEFLVRRMEGPQTAAPLKTTALDFLVPELRPIILERVDRDEFKSSIQPLHRLLAEESLRQATIALRHRSDVGSSRNYRRLLSVLFHGFLSLPVTDGGPPDEPSVQSPDFGIPEVSSKAWEWLYLFAYRRMLEQPPSWYLSRFFGLDLVKRDILVLADKPWSSWPNAAGRPSKVLQRKGIVAARVTDARTRSIAIDYNFSLSQSAYSIGDLGQSFSALENAAEMEHVVAGDLYIDKIGTPRVAKKRIELSLLADDADIPSSVQDWLLSSVNAAGSAVSDYIKNTTGRLENLVSIDNFQPVVHDIPSSVKALEELRDCFGGEEQKAKLSHICDLVFRVAEYHAIKADLQHAEERIRQLKEWQTVRMRDHLSADRFCESMAYFRLAEHLRLSIFSDDPTGFHFFASGHSARQMIRVGLKLEQIARRRVKNADLPHGFFARRSRHMANVITRHLSRYPRERASMLILEASMARLLSVGDDEAFGLQCAREYLARAEAVVMGLGETTRVRMRFLLERVKIHRRLANRATDSNLIDKYREFARSDLKRMSDLNPGHLPLWVQLRTIQSEQLRIESGELAKPPGNAREATRSSSVQR